ncbi:MAG: sensor histidine kinase [Cellulosilyticaceae bacterium]
MLLTIYIYILKREVRHISKQLASCKTGNGKKNIDITLIDKDIEALSVAINEYITFQENYKIDIEVRERKLKDSIASISHDLRTPLTSIKGYHGLLKNTPFSTEDAEYMDIINKKVAVLETLINDFFELSIYESDTYEMEMGRVDVTAIAIEVLMEHYEPIHVSPIAFTAHIPDYPLYVYGERTACERIIQNLISNMLRYAIDEATLTLKNKDDRVYLIMKNRAEEISEEVIQNMFNRFYKSDKSRSHKGTGLGLYIVKTLVDKMNGVVSARNCLDGFIEICIELPLYDYKE